MASICLIAPPSSSEGHATNRLNSSKRWAEFFPLARSSAVMVLATRLSTSREGTFRAETPSRYPAAPSPAPPPSSVERMKSCVVEITLSTREGIHPRRVGLSPSPAMAVCGSSPDRVATAPTKRFAFSSASICCPPTRKLRLSSKEASRATFSDSSFVVPAVDRLSFVFVMLARSFRSRTTYISSLRRRPSVIVSGRCLCSSLFSITLSSSSRMPIPIRSALLAPFIACSSSLAVNTSISRRSGTWCCNHLNKIPSPPTSSKRRFVSISFELSRTSSLLKLVERAPAKVGTREVQREVASLNSLSIIANMLLCHISSLAERSV
mmetsp:Transcript_34983/g.90624  ORF Transcript_34983/g.90624 Transcript_34983/m.90624 type:complete len:323 (-) Transcript_34983:906-1874(-)